MFLTCISSVSIAYAQDQAPLNKPPLELTPRPELKKIEPLPSIVKTEKPAAKPKSSGWVTDKGWVDFDSTKTYPISNGNKPSEWYVLAISPDGVIITFVDKNAVKRKGDAVSFDSWRFGALPKIAYVYDSMVMSLSINCKTMKGSVDKFYFLRDNKIIGEEKIGREGFDPGTEPYSSGFTVCNESYKFPIPVEPNKTDAPKVLEILNEAINKK